MFQDLPWSQRSPAENHRDMLRELRGCVAPDAVAHVRCLAIRATPDSQWQLDCARIDLARAKDVVLPEPLTFQLLEAHAERVPLDDFFARLEEALRGLPLVAGPMRFDNHKMNEAWDGVRRFSGAGITWPLVESLTGITIKCPRPRGPFVPSAPSRSEPRTSGPPVGGRRVHHDYDDLRIAFVGFGAGDKRLERITVRAWDYRLRIAGVKYSQRHLRMALYGRDVSRARLDGTVSLPSGELANVAERGKENVRVPVAERPVSVDVYATIDGLILDQRRGPFDSAAPRVQQPIPAEAADASLYGGRWRVVGEVARGGQGRVHSVVDVKDPRGVMRALKELLPGRGGKALARFKKEITAVRRLQHRNVIAVHDFAVDGDKPFYVMDFHASHVGDYAQLHRRDPAIVLPLVLEICDGVAAAHRQNIVHRDLKPENVLIADDGRPVVTDFGICFIRGEPRHTAIHERVGPRWYMAPELADGKLDDDKVTVRADVYSLGKMLHHLLTGKLFDREKYSDPRFEIVGVTGNEGLAMLNEVFARSIVEDPAGRVADANALREEIKRALPIASGNYRTVNAGGGQRCLFCGRGKYQAHEPGVVGLPKVAGQDVRVLVCAECGHAQLFRANLSGAAVKRWIPSGLD